MLAPLLYSMNIPGSWGIWNKNRNAMIIHRIECDLEYLQCSISCKNFTLLYVDLFGYTIFLGLLHWHHLTHVQLKLNGHVLSIVVTDAMVLKHEDITIHSAELNSLYQISCILETFYS